MKKIGIYKIYSKIKPNRIYIGSSIDIKKRWRQHLVDLKSRNHHSPQLQFHYNKYGKSDLKFEIITTCYENELINIEQFYLDAYRPYFNSAIYAEKSPMLGRKHTIESRKKMSESLNGRIVCEETRKKISEKLTGRDFLHKHKKQSPETIKKRFKNRIGVPRSEETKRKISQSLKGHPPTYNKPRIHSEETKRKISQTLTGKKQSEETKLKRSISAKKANNSGWFKKGYYKGIPINQKNIAS